MTPKLWKPVEVAKSALKQSTWVQNWNLLLFRRSLQTLWNRIKIDKVKYAQSYWSAAGEDTTTTKLSQSFTTLPLCYTDCEGMDVFGFGFWLYWVECSALVFLCPHSRSDQTLGLSSIVFLPSFQSVPVCLGPQVVPHSCPVQQKTAAGSLTFQDGCYFWHKRETCTWPMTMNGVPIVLHQPAVTLALRLFIWENSGWD